MSYMKEAICDVIDQAVSDASLDAIESSAEGRAVAALFAPYRSAAEEHRAAVALDRFERESRERQAIERHERSARRARRGAQVRIHLGIARPGDHVLAAAQHVQ